MSSVSVSAKSSQCLVSSARRYRYLTRLMSSISPIGGILLSRGEIPGRRTFQQLAVWCKPRTVQWALPRFVGVVPVHDAAEVRAYRGYAALHAVHHAAALELPRRAADDAAVVWRAIADPCHRGDPTPCEVQADFGVELHGFRDP